MKMTCQLLLMNPTGQRASSPSPQPLAEEAARLCLGGYAPVSTHRPETAASRPHTDYSRVESVAPLDAKRPYSTLMFSRKERKGRKERTG